MASNAERAATLVRALEAGIVGDAGAVAELVTAEVKGWTPSRSVSSAADLVAALEDRDSAFSDVELEVSPFDVSGDRACVEWIATLTHSGPFALADDVVAEPTGARVVVHGITVAEFEDDHISSFRQYWNEAELFEQLALVVGQ